VSTTATPSSGAARTQLEDASDDASHVTDPQDQGGSPDGDLEGTAAPEDSRVDDEVVDGAESREQDTSPDSESGGKTRGGESPPGVDPEQFSRLQAENAQLRDIVDDVYQRMQRDPDLAKKLGAGGSGPSGPNGVSHYEHVEKTLRESDLKPEAVDILLKALGPIAKDYDRRVREDETVRSRLDRVDREVGQTVYSRSLIDAGVSPDVQRSAPFRKFAESVESDPRVRSIRDPSLRAEYVASKYLLAQSRRSGYRADADRVATAKTGRNGSQPSSGASQAVRTVEVPRGPGCVDKADAIRVEAANAGKPIPKIVFVNKKT
jgi:hypothetical protein